MKIYVAIPTELMLVEHRQKKCEKLSERAGLEVWLDVAE
jgi:hypothetical protein